jgi:calcineurin-like phosphoesterase family protein
MAAYFTSDLHFGDAGIIEYCKRPFKSFEHMERRMIDTINARVKPGDTLYHIGDFNVFGPSKGFAGARHPASYYEDQINGKVIHIMGNHDANNKVKDGVSYAVIRMANINVLMVHKPEDMYVKGLLDSGQIQLVLSGHVHDAWSERVVDGILRINVGVDVRRFVPMSKSSILKIYQRWKGSK